MNRRVAIIAHLSVLFTIFLVFFAERPFSAEAFFVEASEKKAASAVLPESRSSNPFDKALELARIGEFERAEGILKPLALSTPALAPYVSAVLAEVKLLAADTPAALSLLEEVAVVKERAVADRAFERRVFILAQERRFSEAAEGWRDLANRRSGDRRTAARISEARVRLNAGETEPAVALLTAVLDEKTNPQVKAQAAGILLRLGRARGSLLIRLAEVFNESGEFTTAAQLFEDAAKTSRARRAPSEETADLLFRSAGALERSDRFSSAIRLYRKLQAEYPRYSTQQVKFRIGLCYQRLGKDKQGEKFLLQVLAAAPRSEYADDILYRLASRRDSKDDRATALRYYRRLMKEFPKSRWADVAAWKAGFAYFEDGELSEASKAFEAALRRNPRSDYASAMGYWRGRVLESLGDSRALGQYLAVVRSGADNYYRSRAAASAKRLGFTPDVGSLKELAARARSGDAAAVRELVIFCETGDGAAASSAVREIRSLLSASGSWSSLATLAEERPDPRKLLLGGGNPELLAEIVALVGVGAYDEAAAELLALGVDRGAGPSSRVARAQVFAHGGEYRRAIREIEVLVAELGPVPHPAALPFSVAGLLYPRHYDSIITAEAEKNGLDPHFVRAVIREESRFDANIASWAGAQGLMQIMPATGAGIARRLNMTPFHREHLRDPHVNIAMGAHYLRRMKDLYDGREYMALAGYNAGPGNTNRWLRQNSALDEEIWIEKISFKETRNYVKRVLGTWWTYQKIYAAS